MLRMPWQDHRARPVRLYRSGLVPLPFAGEHPIDPIVWKRMRTDAMARWAKNWRDPPPRPPGTKKPFYWRAIVCAVLPGLWMFIAMFGTRWLFMPNSWLGLAVMPLGFLPLFGLMWWIHTRSLNQWPPEEIEKGMLGESHCPQCGYPLHDVRPEPPPEGDGCRLCPECGAAWRMEGAVGHGRITAEGSRIDG